MRKSISGEHGLPLVKTHGGLRLRKLNAEHGIIDILDPSVSLEVGDTLEIWCTIAMRPSICTNTFMASGMEKWKKY
jgi:hypothetical protein